MHVNKGAVSNDVDSNHISSDIKSILESERRAEQILMDAKKSADKIIVKWKEEMQKEMAKINSEVVAYKNEAIKKGMRDVDNEVDRLLKKKEKEAEKIRTMKVDKKVLERIANNILSLKYRK